MLLYQKIKKVRFNTMTIITIIDAFKKRISDYLSDEITKIARELPEHTVIPYRNIPRKYYLSNKDITEVPR